MLASMKQEPSRELARARLFDLGQYRGEIIAAVEERIISGRVQAAWDSRERGLEYVLNEAAYFEMSRLEGSRVKRHSEQRRFWHDLALTVGRNAEDENADILASLVRKYANDIVGQFNPMAFRVATRVVPVGLNALFNAQGFRAVRQFQRLADRIRIQGDVARLKRLSQLGTLVFTPTHSSHMDSILLGWALEEVGLPPVTYGAGKNLFRRPLTAFFLRNLGAYKVDRRLRHSLYKEVLKTVSQIFLEEGFHSLFFPAGTRSRNGSVDSRLKLGLIGSAIDGYVESLMQGRAQRVFIVPVTINYHLVLEAETLIADFLRTDGQSRFIIEDDEFSDLGRVLRFAMNTMAMENPISLHFSTPLDPFGNEVDDDGESNDRQGRRVDPARYALTRDGYKHVKARDREYARWLGVQISDSFKRNNVIFSIHLVALALFEILRFRHSRWDLYNMIRFGRGEFVAIDDLVGWCQRLLEIAREQSLTPDGEVRLGPLVAKAGTNQVVEVACSYFTKYHSRPLVSPRGNGIELGNMPLLFYYSNRARGYGFEQLLRTS